MTKLEIDTCNLCEDLTPGEIDNLISELQMIADQKYADIEKEEEFPDGE